MQKSLFLLLSVLALTSCQAQKTINKKYKTKIMMPIVTKDFETFDSLNYEKLKVKSSDINEFLNDGTFVETLKAKGGDWYNETPPHSYFSLTKIYYDNGNIKKKGLEFNWVGFQKGVWYEFNEQGKLIKEIDYDRPFKFTWEDVLRFCEKEKIPVQIGPVLQSTGFHTTIKRSVSPVLDVAIWEIQWLKEGDLTEQITLDGENGRVVKRVEIKYTNN